MQTTPHDSPGMLVFWYQTSGRNWNKVTPNKDSNAGWVG